MNRILSFLAAVFSALLLCVFPQAPAEAADTLSVRFYNYGKADAILITTPAGQHILIDTAYAENGTNLVSKLQNEGITDLDLLIITHYDKDHVGGAAKVLKKIHVKEVYMPDYKGSGEEYDNFISQLKKCDDTEAEVLGAGTVVEFPLDGDNLSFTVYAAEKDKYGTEEENDHSIACKLIYGKTSYLFTGDAEQARQTELLMDGICKCSVLKVPYHGRMTNTTAAFLKACNPAIAYITDSSAEPADKILLWTLDDMGTTVYRSSTDGSVTVFSDGEKVWSNN